MPVTEELRPWQDLTIDNFLGGLFLEGDSELLEDNQVLTAKNLVFRDRRLSRDTGYVPFLSAVLGTPQKHITYKLSSGAIQELLITTTTVYRNVNNQWRYVSDGTSTTLSVGETTGATAIDVASITGFSNGDRIGIVLDSGQMHLTTISGAPAAGVITIAVGLPSAAAIGKVLLKSINLTGSIEKHVTAAPVPWGGYLVFTNGVNSLKYYDPTSDVVTEVPNLPGGGGLICQTLALYDNSIIVANLTEGGVNYPSRYRYCAKGDLTEWAALEAGYVDLLEVDSEILQALRLGPYLVLYRSKSINRVGVSSSLLRRFDNDTAVNNVGIFSNYGAVDLTDKHMVWANDGIYWYLGGFGVEPIVSGIYNPLFGPGGELAENTRNRAFVVLLKKLQEVLFVYQPPGSSGPNKASRYHLKYTNWTTREFADNLSGFGSRVEGDSLDWSELIGDWIDQIGAWSSYNTSGNVEQPTLCSSTQDQVLVYDYRMATDDGVAIPAVLETKDFAHPTYLLRHDFLDVFIRGGTILVEYSTDKGTSWQTLGTIVGQTITQRHRFFRQFVARHFRYRFSTSGAVAFIALHLRFKYEYEW